MYRPSLAALAPLSFIALLVVGCNAILGYDSATLASGVTSDDAGDPNTCAAYCANIQVACTGVNAEYINTFVCLAMCQQFEPGVPGDETQNSLACRIWHTTAAKSDPALHCRHAGPLGGGVCGTDPCSEFCDLTQALCSTQPSPPYSSESACETACPNFTYDEATNDGDLAEESGNTLNCRIYHLESAYDTQDNPDATSTHCPHTAVNSATCN
jgi:hypothetical protein